MESFKLRNIYCNHAYWPFSIFPFSVWSCSASSFIHFTYIIYCLLNLKTFLCAKDKIQSIERQTMVEVSWLKSLGHLFSRFRQKIVIWKQTGNNKMKKKRNKQLDKNLFLKNYQELLLILVLFGSYNDLDCMCVCDEGVPKRVQ